MMQMWSARRRLANLAVFMRAGLVGLMLTMSSVSLARAQELAPSSPAQGQTPIERRVQPETDADIKSRLQRIYGEFTELADLDVRVAEGVVTLTGETVDRASSEQAQRIAKRVVGVVAVRDETTASVDVSEKISPFIARLGDLMDRALSTAPLVVLATLVFAIMTGFAFLLAGWSGLWRRITPNIFLADLVAQAVRVVGVVAGIVVALNLAGATTLMTAILGGAGVIGLAVGFAIRDSLENYISSIMLSLRQPFRANDHVVIDGHEGKVMRLTSRATILMTLDGNHLRVPNATVYKAIILNYTRNPERRFQFELGVDAGDDPQGAISCALASMQALDFVLKEPPPNGAIKEVGDSSIVLTFMAWIDQGTADFLKARSEAIRSTKLALEGSGYTLPEPIYRLRIDQFPQGTSIRTANESLASPPRPIKETATEAVSVAPEDHLDDKIDEERRQQQDDLLDQTRPTE